GRSIMPQQLCRAACREPSRAGDRRKSRSRCHRNQCRMGVELHPSRIKLGTVDVDQGARPQVVTRRRTGATRIAPRKAKADAVMTDMLEVDLSRWQFAITAMYLFIFVPLTLGLSVIMAIMESVYLM